MIEVKLFRFSLPDIDEVLYLYSLRSDEAFLREQFLGQDQGDTPFEIYRKLYSEGRIERIVSITQVPNDPNNPAPLYRGGEQDWYPYHSYEIENGHFELTIKEFFDPPEIYR